MKQLVKVHMLPTEDKTDILSVTMGKLTELRYIPLLIKEELSPEDYKIKSYQHLYFTSDEKIKKGDYAYDEFNKVVFKSGSDNPGASRKIVATTDKSLKLKSKCDCSESESIYCGKLKTEGLCQQLLSQIPQSFIEDYCKAGGIDEVLLECGEYCEYCGEEYCDNLRCKGYKDIFQYALDQNNCVIIHPVKPKLYTREHMRLSFKEGYNAAVTSINNNRYDEDYEVVKFDDWIKGNLK